MTTEDRLNTLQNEVSQLAETIAKHDQNYWIKNNPIISDYEYDQLVKRLKELSPNHYVINKLHQSIVSNNTRNKVKHTVPMLSLDKAYEYSEVIAWATKIARTNDEVFRIELKLDGLSAEFKGKDKVLSTRGDDGIYGEDITDKIPIIHVDCSEKIYPLDIVDFDIRGEILMRKDYFETHQSKLLRKNGLPYKTTRSAAIGLIAADDTDLSIGRPLTLVEFSKYGFELSFIALKNATPEYWKQLEQWASESIYSTDGLVIKLADKEYSESLGNTSHHPRGQIALKFEAPSGITTLTEVKWQLGKNSLTPVGYVEPVEISGFTNSKISLHNYKYILDNQLAINDKIAIERRGEIIPQLKNVISYGDPRYVIEPPKVCPSCQHPVVYDEPEIRCVNLQCRGRLLQTLTDGVQRLGIEYVSESTIAKLLGYYDTIHDIADILDLTKADFLVLEGFAETSAENAFQQIQKVKNSKVEDWKILAALNITGIGKSMSKKLLKVYTFTELMSLSVDQLTQLDAIGPTRANLLNQYFQSNKSLIDKIFSRLQIIHTKSTNTNPIKGKVCFTGKDSNPRNTWIKLAESNGYEFSNSVGKTLKYLVTNDPNGSSSKLTKAAKFGTKIITYEEFKKMVV